MLGGFKLGRLFGVQILVDWSLLVIVALITFDLGAGLFPAWHPAWTPVTSWTLALAAALLLVASVLAHELSHALVARANGIPVRRITLFVFGGLAHIEGEPPTPRSELLMALVGPVSSVVIGVAAIAGAMSLAGEGLRAAVASQDPAAIAAAVGASGPGATLLLWLGPVNVMLGVFNIVPGFPLDGGRVFRSIAWAATGDVVRATRWAARGGQLFAWLLMGVGAGEVLGGSMGGFWLLLIGWFLSNAARYSYRELVMKRAFGDVTVAGVMETRLDRLPPDLSVQAFVEDHLMASDERVFPVEADGNLAGMVRFSDVQRVPRTEWATTRIERIMTPTAELAALPPDAAAERAYEELAEGDVEQVAVVEGHHLVGLVRRRDLVKWQALHGSGASPTGS